jgi:hypothetical protein
MPIFPIQQTPNVVGTPLLWLDPSDSNYMTESGGSASQIVCKARGTIFTQPTGAKQFTTTGNIHGLKCFTGDGANTWMESTTNLSFPANACTIFAVAQGVSGGSHRYIVGIAADQCLFFGSFGGNYAAFFGNGSVWNNIAANTPNVDVSSAVKILNCVQNGNNTPSVNNTAQDVKVDAMAAFNQKVRIGSNLSATQNWSGKIGDVIIYPYVLSAADILAVHRYLSNKYGIAIA